MRFCLLFCVASLLVAAGGLSNRRAPGFSLQDSKGQQHDLYDYRGKLVLIEIMQTSCPHCRAFSKILDQVKAKYGDRVVSLSVVNPPDTPANVARYLAEVKPSTPILFDSGQMAISYFKLTPESPGIDLPHLFIIDGNGWIVSDYAYGDATKGIFEGTALFPELDRLLAAKKK
jgi:thiol-disulfide isomerase/thioredoxin